MLTLTNEPIAVTLAGQNLKVRRLAFGRMLALAEAAVVSAHLARIQSLAAGLPQEAREGFLAASIAHIPHGTVLDGLAADWAASYDGGVAYLYEAIRQDQPEMTLEQVRGLIDAAPATEVYPIACWIAGRDGGNVPRGTVTESGKKN